jgi:adenylate kinase family enzyme
MKSIILAGASRSGKTTIARRLKQKTGFSLVSGDALVSTFGSIFPQLGIAHENKHEVTTKNLQDFIIVYLNHLVTYENIPFIFDTFHLTPEQVIEFKLNEKYEVAFFGYPDITAEEKFKNIRNHKTAHYDWSDECSDESLLAQIETFIERSKIIRDSCEKLGLNFIDTSRDFKPTLDNAFNNILKNIGFTPDI